MGAVSGVRCLGFVLSQWGRADVIPRNEMKLDFQKASGRAGSEGVRPFGEHTLTVISPKSPASGTVVSFRVIAGGTEGDLRRSVVEAALAGVGLDAAALQGPPVGRPIGGSRERCDPMTPADSVEDRRWVWLFRSDLSATDHAPTARIGIVGRLARPVLRRPRSPAAGGADTDHGQAPGQGEPQISWSLRKSHTQPEPFGERAGRLRTAQAHRRKLTAASSPPQAHRRKLGGEARGPRQ